MIRDLVLLAISMFAWGLGEGLFFYFQPLYLQELGADPLKIGVILGAFGMVMTISHIPAGYLADRIGRKPLLVAAWILGTAATWTMALAHSLPGFVTGLMLYGLTLFVMSPLYSYITTARGKFSVGRAITLISAGFNLGAVMGPWLGGMIGDLMGLRYTYLFAGSIFIVSTMLILFIRPQPVEQIPHEARGNGWMLERRYLAYLGVIFLAMFAMYLPQPLTANFMQNERSIALIDIGKLYSISSIGVVCLNLALGQLPARYGFLLAQLAVGIFSLTLWKGGAFPLYMLGFFMLGGYKTARSLGIAQMRELIHQTRMGLAYGMAETVSASAIILAPIFAGYLYTWNPSWMYPVAAAFIGMSLLTSIRFSPKIRMTIESPMAPIPSPINRISSAGTRISERHSDHP